MGSDEDAYLKNLTPSGARGRVGEGYLQGKLRWRPSDYVSVNALAYHLRTRAPGMFEYEYLPLDTGLYNRTYGTSLNGGRRAVGGGPECAMAAAGRHAGRGRLLAERGSDLGRLRLRHDPERGTGRPHLRPEERMDGRGALQFAQ
ncbi:hypothetical protein G6F64_014203 [Rhizopus arrhizus]|uniref:Uncharacterized protein n=1 Tax=Rhizopus oryzae TaxID=64495 RepID=A0A9P6WUJ1_RHIOR|nr:hypothetical protein G6F64_014203 [Rhizopus arrhizus]